MRRLDDVAVGQHHALGLARRAGCVQHHAGAVVIQLGLRAVNLGQARLRGAALVLNIAILRAVVWSYLRKPRGSR